MWYNLDYQTDNYMYWLPGQKAKLNFTCVNEIEENVSSITDGNTLSHAVVLYKYFPYFVRIVDYSSL